MDGGTDLRTRRPIPCGAGEIGAAAQGTNIRCMARRGKARVCGGSGGVLAQTHIIGQVGHDGHENGSGRKGAEDLGFGRGQDLGTKGSEGDLGRRRGQGLGMKGGAARVWATRAGKEIWKEGGGQCLGTQGGEIDLRKFCKSSAPRVIFNALHNA